MDHVDGYHLLEVDHPTVVEGPCVRKYSDVGGTMVYTKDPVPVDRQSLCYAGQRKLLMNEIDFLDRHLAMFGHEDIKRVVYIGSAPGAHIVALHLLFPDVFFTLYDPRHHDSALFDIARRDRQGRVEIHQRKYEIRDAREWSEVKHLVISDIRDPNVSEIKLVDGELTGEQADKQFDIISTDQQHQKLVIMIADPLACSLKFKLPWTDGSTTYLDGEIRVQSWTKHGSAETRLWCARPYTQRDYDNVEYERVMTYYRNVVRSRYYEYPQAIVDKLSESGQYVRPPGMCHCHDCYTDLCILSEYVDTPRAKKTLRESVAFVNRMLVHNVERCVANILNRYGVGDAQGVYKTLSEEFLRSMREHPLSYQRHMTRLRRRRRKYRPRAK